MILRSKQITEMCFCVTACKDLRLVRISHAPILFTVHNFQHQTQKTGVIFLVTMQSTVYRRR